MHGNIGARIARAASRAAQRSRLQRRRRSRELVYLWPKYRAEYRRSPET